MKHITKQGYEAPEACGTCLSQACPVLAGSDYIFGGGGDYTKDDIIDNGEY